MDTEGEGWVSRPPSFDGSSNTGFRQQAASADTTPRVATPRQQDGPPSPLLRLHGFHKNMYTSERTAVLDKLLDDMITPAERQTLKILPGGHLEK